jgi:hypothetical protein
VTLEDHRDKKWYRPCHDDDHEDVVDHQEARIYIKDATVEAKNGCFAEPQWEYRKKLEDEVVSSVKVGENHVVLGYRRERPMYWREHALVQKGKCVRANMQWNLGQTEPARAGDPTADKLHWDH